MSYYISKKVDYDFEQAIDKVTAELKEEGFGVLTEIDVKETLKKKLDVDFKKYKILGACNPNFAHQALQHEDKIGTMQAVDNKSLATIAEEVRGRLEKVIEAV